MTWNKDDYPAAMKNLPTSVRNKAISIANSLIEENYDEGRAISIAIASAKDAANNSNPKENDSSITYHILPHPEGWSARKANAEKATYVCEKKADAMGKVLNLLQKHGGRLVIHDSDGSIQEHRNY